MASRPPKPRGEGLSDAKTAEFEERTIYVVCRFRHLEFAPQIGRIGDRLFVGLKKDATVVMSLGRPDEMFSVSAYITSVGDVRIYGTDYGWFSPREWRESPVGRRLRRADLRVSDRVPADVWDAVGPSRREIEEFLQTADEPDEEAAEMLWLAVAADEIRLDLESRGLVISDD